MPVDHAVIDIVWVLLCAALVMLMQAGFCCLESGLVRSKNSINVAFKNFADFLISSALFWMFGFAVMFGLSYGGLFGTTGFFFEGDAAPWLVAFFLFQLMFCGTATTIVSGAVAERMRFSGYLVVAAILSGLIYPVIGHWVWGGAASGTADGWLAARGFIDFAGTTVVHSVGGWVSLAAIIIIGPRIGRFDNDGTPIHGHDLPLVTLGVFLLWFGWFGFNGGSTLGLTDAVPLILVNTTVSGAFGGLVALAVSWRVHGRPDVGMIMNGSLAGLVGITGSAHIMTPLAAMAIGMVAGAVMFAGTVLLERLKLDDVVGAFPVHCCGGIWGTLAIPIFGDPATWGTGLTRWEQFVVQATGVGACFAWAFGLGFALLWLINRWIPLRIDPEGERIGLNVAEHGASTEVLDLLTEMDQQRQANDFSNHVLVEPHTEIGKIASQYNRVLDDINAETAQREAAMESLHDKTASLELLQKIAAAAHQAASIGHAMQTCVDEVCKYTGWPVGHVYMLDEDGSGQLIPTQIWHIDDAVRYREFREITEATNFASGVGIPGRVLANGEPAWITDVTNDPNFPRSQIAQEIGIRAGLAFPVLVGEETAAVLEFFTPEPIAPDEAMLAVMASVGLQLGRVTERKRAEEARFRGVVDNLPATVVLRDMQGRYVLINRAYEKLYGLKNSQVRGKTLHEVMPKDKAEEYADFDREVVERRQVVEAEDTVTMDDGEHSFAVVKFPIIETGGEITAIGGIALDITRRKAAEQALAQAVQAKDTALQELSAVLDTIDYGILFMDSKLDVRTTNSAFRQILSIPKNIDERKLSFRDALEIARDRGLHDVDEDQWEDYVAARIEAVERGSIEPTEMRLANGKILQYQCIALPDGGRMLTYFDITNLKEVEEALRESEQRMVDAIESISESFALCDAEDRLIIANSRYREMFFPGNENLVVEGDTVENLVRKSVESGLIDLGGQDAEAFITERMTQHAQPSAPILLHQTNGLWVQVDERKTEDGGTVTVGTDITDIKQVEIELRKARDQATRATQFKSQFLANMSHELRTPMNAIIGFTRLVMRRAKQNLEAKQYENLEKILASAERLLALINDILDLSKIEAGQMKVYPTDFDLDSVIGDSLRTVEPIVRGERLRLIQDIEPALPPVYSDQDKFRQILINLLSNAIKFTDEGAVTVTARRRDANIEIQVSDTGIGIPEEALDLIFQEFRQADDSSTRRHGGTGLGLAITRYLVKLLGGDITVESIFGKGSTFTIIMPQCYTAAEASSPGDDAEEDPSPKKAPAARKAGSGQGKSK